MKLNKQRLNSKGFSHIEMILAVVVIVAIAGVGIFVYKHHQDNSKSMSSMNLVNKTGTTTTKPVTGSVVKASSVNVNGKSLVSIVPKASAQNLTEIDASPPGYTMYACWTQIPPYGVIQVTAYFWKPAAAKGIYSYIEQMEPDGGGGWSTRYSSNTSRTYFYGVVTTASMITYPAYYADRIFFFEQNSNASINAENSFNFVALTHDIVQC